MIGQITTSLGDLGLNIVDMTNVSRGEVAYNLIDVENKVDIVYNSILPTNPLYDK